MGFILRLASRATWSGAAPDDEQRARAAKSFERRDVDTDGISVYEIENTGERDLVVAAIACARADDKPVDFIEVPREQLEAYGPVVPTPGELSVPAANALHRCLDWDAGQLRRLAEDLCEARTAATRVATTDVRAIVARLEPSDVTGDEAAAFVLRMREKTRRT